MTDETKALIEEVSLIKEAGLHLTRLESGLATALEASEARNDASMNRINEVAQKYQEENKRADDARAVMRHYVENCRDCDGKGSIILHMERRPCWTCEPARKALGCEVKL